MTLRRVLAGLALVALLGVSAANAAEWGLKKGTPGLKSAGPLAFGPDGILLVGDTKGATVFAIDTSDTKGDPSKAQYDVENVNAKAAKLLGAEKVTINDLAVNPMSGNVYLSVSQGAGPDGKPALLRINPAGKLSQVALKNVAFSKATLPNPPADRETGQGRRRRNNRGSSITDLAFIDGKVLISGLSAEASPSNVREIEFPFTDKANQGTSLEIFHGAHGKLEDSAPSTPLCRLTSAANPTCWRAFNARRSSSSRSKA